MEKPTEYNLDDSEIHTILSKDIHFKGKLKFSRSLKILGQFEGDIEAPEGYLLIGKGAVIKARISAMHLSNSGRVDGDAMVNGFLEICSGAEVNGNVNIKELAVEQGGALNGHISMPKSTKN